MPEVLSNGNTIYYETHGRGEPIVLIPGIGTDISEYDRIIAPLSKKYKVIALDTIGTGRSDKPDIAYSLEQMADDTAAVMRAASVRRANILGVSIGGRIALALALQHPEKIKSLMLISSAARATKRTQWSRFLGVIARFPLLQSKYPQPSFAQERLRQASLTYDCTDNLSRIKLPTLIVHARQDGIVPLPLAQAMHDKLTSSKLLTVNGGHLFFLLTRRKTFLAAVDEFLRV